MASPASGTPSAGTTGPAVNSTTRAGSAECYCVPMPPAQQAALLFAAGFVDPAQAILENLIRDPVENSNKQPWLMLFDLFEFQQNRVRHDDLGKRYKLKFRQTAPAWAGGGEDALDPRRAQNRERKDFFTLQPDAAGVLEPEIRKFYAFAKSMGTVRLELGRIASITAAEAALLAAALRRLRRADVPIWLNSTSSLERVLRAAINEGVSEATRNFWVLLFEVYVLQADRGPFEELGLEYAIAFEMPPPEWETYVNRVAAASRTPEATAAAAPAKMGFALKGVISAASQSQLANLADYAATLAEVVIDMGKVMRVDFASCAQFFDVMNAMKQNGRRVILVNLSELNAAFLEAFGVNGNAMLIRRNEY